MGAVTLSNYKKFLNVFWSQEAAPEDSDLLKELLAAAQAVRDAMNSLLQKVRDGSWEAQQAGQYDAACDDILGATDRLFNSMGNAGEMVKQAKILAQVGIYIVFFLPYLYLQSALTMKYIIVKSRSKPAINFLSSCFSLRHLLRW